MDALAYLHGRRILVTGHTGFKGAWLCLWLRLRGARVAGFALDIPTTPSLFETFGLAREMRHHVGDIRDLDALARVVERERPEIIFHLAAQPLVRRSYLRPKETFDTNVGGTVNVLECARQASDVRVVIAVTSDKCYDNRGGPWGYRETDPLGGADPYSASKAAAELVVAAYRESFFPSVQAREHAVGLASVRAGNVIGGGDWAVDRIVPDCVRSLAAGEPVAVRHPDAIRPWQHVLEPLAGYLALAGRLWEDPAAYAGPWNFGPPADGARTVAELVREVIQRWGAGRWQGPHSPVRALHEAECLRLSSDKALARLPWRPQWRFRSAVKRTVEWYRAFFAGATAKELRTMCRGQIMLYESAWARSAAGSQRAVFKPASAAHAERDLLSRS